MAVQSREVYMTGDPKIDRVLARIGERLDVIEGLRPDQSGLMEIESDKDITTRSTSSYLETEDAGSMAEQSSDDVDITGGTISGVDIEADKIKVKDSNDTVIHQLGED